MINLQSFVTKITLNKIESFYDCANKNKKIHSKKVNSDIATSTSKN